MATTPFPLGKQIWVSAGCRLFRHLELLQTATRRGERKRPATRSESRHRHKAPASTYSAGQGHWCALSAGLSTPAARLTLPRERRCRLPLVGRAHARSTLPLRKFFAEPRSCKPIRRPPIARWSDPDPRDLSDFDRTRTASDRSTEIRLRHCDLSFRGHVAARRIDNGRGSHRDQRNRW